MAESDTETPHPWQPDYDEKWKSSVFENEVLLSKLTEYLTAIVKSLDLSDKFWSLLVQHSVVDEDAKTRIQGYKQRQAQAVSLVHHVMNVEVYKFHGFVWALVNSNQCHLAELLGFAVRDYLDVDVYLKSSSFRCPACHEFYTKAYIMSGCGHYVCAPCVKGAQFICKDNKKEDVTCPVPECGKITEASPSDGNIGLEEDENFSNLCQAVLKQVGREAAETTEGKSGIKEEEEDHGGDHGGGVPNERQEEEAMSTTDSDLEEDLPERLKGGISDLKSKISCLQKHRDVLEKFKPGVKDYITGAVEKIKEDLDEWAKETLEEYSSICQQVEKNLQKSVKWQNAASELSVIVSARPELLEGCLKDKVNIPEKTLTDEEEKLITKLDAGCPIPPLLRRFPYISNSPGKAKYIQTFKLGDISLWGVRKVAWMPDGSLMVLTDELLTNGCLWRIDLNTDTGECKPTLVYETSKAVDMSVAAEGTWILSLKEAGIIEIHYPGLEEVKQWRPEGVNEPYQVFINNKNIFVGEVDSQIIRSYSRKLVYVDQYDIGTDDNDDYIHVTERGRLLKSSCTENKINTMDLETKNVSSFGSEGRGDGELKYPFGMCTVSDEEYILVCDCDNNRVSVFTHDGHFIHHLHIDENVECPHNIAVLARQGKPTLMALCELIDGKEAVCLYRLE